MTLYNYTKCIERLPDPLDAITPLDLTEMLGRRRNEVGAAALAYEVRAYRAFFGWLSEQLDQPNPASNLKTPKVDEPLVRSIALEEHRALLATCENTRLGRRDVGILCLLWSTGMRRSEVARMEKDHVELPGRTVVISKSKTGRARTVGLDDEATLAFRRYLRSRSLHVHFRSPYFWLSTRGHLTADGVRQMLERRSARAGVDVQSHMYRRALAERWLAGGGSEALLKAYAGWRRPQMVANYARANAEKLAIAEHRRLL
jgi:site-specific recombinase XerD